MTKQEFKEIRLALGLSQQQLASKLGILKNRSARLKEEQLASQSKKKK